MEILHIFDRFTALTARPRCGVRTSRHKAKTLQRLVNNSKQAQRFGQIVYKYGVHIPRNEKEAISLDRENGNTYWQDAIAKETGQLFEYKVFQDLGKNAAVPKGYQQIKLRIVFNVKQFLKRKARIVARGDMTDPPCKAVYSGVASLRSLRIVCLLAKLNGLKLTGGDVVNAYLEACTTNKVCSCWSQIWTIGRSLIGDRESIVGSTYFWSKISREVC